MSKDPAWACKHDHPSCNYWRDRLAEAVMLLDDAYYGKSPGEVWSKECRAFLTADQPTDVRQELWDSMVDAVRCFACDNAAPRTPGLVCSACGRVITADDGSDG